MKIPKKLSMFRMGLGLPLNNSSQKDLDRPRGSKAELTSRTKRLIISQPGGGGTSSGGVAN